MVFFIFLIASLFKVNKWELYKKKSQKQGYGSQQQREGFQGQVRRSQNNSNIFGTYFNNIWEFINDFFIAKSLF